jgi:CRP-like cAMP-binding protein
VDRQELIRKHSRYYQRGTVLFEQGDEGHEMFVIHAGRVAISRRVGEREKVLAVLPPGEFFGEMSIINNRPRSATARVVEDAQLLSIDARRLETMIRSNSEIAVRLLKKLAARLDEATRQIEVLLYRNPSSRVVHFLRQQAEQMGVPAATGVAIDLSERQIAGHLGLTPDEVTTVIARLERARLVARGPQGGFLVAEVGKLQDFLDFIEMQQRFGPGVKQQ